MMTALFLLWQCSWGILQTLAGAAVFLCNRRRPFLSYHGAIVSRWRFRGSVSLGMFVFVSEEYRERDILALISHEYGHCIQSLILGPLYLLVIGLPSFIWAGAFKKIRQRRGMSYYRFYTERWANALTEKITGDKAPR